MSIEYATLLMRLQAKSLRIMREEKLAADDAKTQASRQMAMNRMWLHAHRIQRINQIMKQAQ